MTEDNGLIRIDPDERETRKLKEQLQACTDAMLSSHWCFYQLCRHSKTCKKSGIGHKCKFELDPEKCRIR